LPQGLVNLGQNRAGLGESLRQGLAHADGLRSLTWKNESLGHPVPHRLFPLPAIGIAGGSSQAAMARLKVPPGLSKITLGITTKKNFALKDKLMRGSGARQKCGGAVVASLLEGRVPRLVETKEQAGVSGHRPVRVTRHFSDFPTREASFGALLPPAWPRDIPKNGARQKCNMSWNNERVNDSTRCSSLCRETLMV